jgi:hypothetical protein
VGAELFHVDRRIDGRTDVKKKIIASRNFANTPDNGGVKSAIFSWRRSVSSGGGGGVLYKHNNGFSVPIKGSNDYLLATEEGEILKCGCPTFRT